MTIDDILVSKKINLETLNNLELKKINLKKFPMIKILKLLQLS